MAKIFLIIIAFAALVCAEEDVEQKKRGAVKTTSLNSIPTGVQKPDYTYNIYSNPSGGQSSSPSYQSQSAYQSQVPNSFYPSQNNQYYTSDTPTDSSYPQQPQINLIPPTTPSQFVPLNFVPNSGYQAKYQIIPSKNSQGNIQLAIVQQPSNYPSSVLQYPNSLISSASQISQQNSPFGGIPNGYFNIAPNYQPFAFGGPQLGQSPAMVLVPQGNPSLYNNLLYPNPVQSFYNYYPSNSQGKYSVSYGSQQASEASQSSPKESNDGQNLEYASSDVNPSYKNAFTPSRGSSYTKLK
ncbi:uncharacterized protein LOC128674178 [Plodia interpunctella]|uniref:uncharacterized protein LOC128674178 n=1 Tax=Plodia interpunctella TaxID=58824 RepID=UPI002368A451|nr:uncharacterized protein LOC128674178 [Plodia interpunctella]